MKYLIRVKVPFELNKIVEAENFEEARRKALELEPDEFDNFDLFYEWLGDSWRRISENVVVEPFD